MPNLLSEYVFIFFLLIRQSDVCTMYVQWGQNMYEVSFQLKGVPYFAISTKADPIYSIFHHFSFKWEITKVPLHKFLKMRVFLSGKWGKNGF